MDWSSIIQTALEMAIQILLPVALGFVVIFIKQQISAIKSKLDQENLAIAGSFVKAFVLAAEQSGLTGKLNNVGEEKKAWVLAQLDAALNVRGIDLDFEVLSALIEAAVYEAWHNNPVPEIEE